MDFLKQKWAYWFDVLDVNHDGIITQTEVQKTLHDFPKVEGLGKKEGFIADGIIEHWWNWYILKGRDEVTKQDFIDNLEKQYVDDKEGFKQMIQNCLEEILPVLDVEHNDTISLDNYVKAYKVWGHNNEALIKKTFELYNPKEGMIPMHEYINDWRTFITNDDPAVKDVVFDTLKEGI